MIRHLNKNDHPPRRLIVLGGSGFIGKAIATESLKAGINVISLGRDDIDLVHPDSGTRLAKMLDEGDAIMMSSARAPAKTFEMMLENLTMLKPLIYAIGSAHPSHIVYVSSDAVYSDSPDPLSEFSETNPATVHGIMHKTRETILQNEVSIRFGVPFVVIRPTLIYGKDDPHNGYGPNKFFRLVQTGKNISIFGKGEELRDHVSIHDVAQLTVKLLLRRSEGVLNIATGDTSSFRDIAKQIIALSKLPLNIDEIPRAGPMPHNGYRAFDTFLTKLAFPEFSYKSLETGLIEMSKEMKDRPL
ncbi:MAG: NAD-dependent dehydratase [Rhodospirillaceae bacterium]|nr:NAD-dependent dehydratase [Rhodospirillaceae bacterium]